MAVLRERRDMAAQTRGMARWRLLPVLCRREEFQTVSTIGHVLLMVH